MLLHVIFLTCRRDMLAEFADFLIFAIFRVTPLAVALTSARRLFRSRSLNSMLYALTCAFALTALLGGASDAVSGVLSALCLPLWLLVREVCRPRIPPPGIALKPVFASVRAAAARGELHRRPTAAT